MAPINLTNLFGINPVNSVSAAPVNFRGGEKVDTFSYSLEGYQDKYVSNPMGVEFFDASKIKKYAAKLNPEIISLLRKYGPIQVNMEALESLRKGHLSTTRLIAAGIYSALPENLKREANNMYIQQAAMLHDYGKVLIPKKILEKEGSLTPEEKKIMELHSEIGYELLKQQGINEQVLKLVKYHHQRPDGKGYPAAGDDFEYDINSQILTVADKYSALTESRCYRKEACSETQALDIICEDVKNGLISKEVFDALVNSVFPQYAK